MPSRSDFENAIIAELSSYPDLAERYSVSDPTLTVQLGSIADFLTLLSNDMTVSELEPFIKTKDRTILADATGKAILPLAKPAQYSISITNSRSTAVILSAGRIVNDGQGRGWRLLASVTIPPVSIGMSGTVLGQAYVTCEQSQVSTQVYTVPTGEALHTVRVDNTSGMSFCQIPVVVDSLLNQYQYAPRWMNVAVGDHTFTAITDSKRSLLLQFGMQDRVGIEVVTGDVFKFTLTETFGELDITQLKTAVLSEIDNPAETALAFSFINGTLIQAGSDALDLSHLRQLSTYPALYDENAVYLGNFDFLVRRYFAMRCDFISVWNEAIKEKAFGSVTVADINRLFVTVVPSTGVNPTILQSDVALKIAAADNLYTNRVVFVAVSELEYPLKISGSIASVYNLDAVIEQIGNLLLAQYGRGQVAVSKVLANGINLQDISKLIKDNVSAFQDQSSDFSLSIVGTPSIYPNTWAYLTAASITYDIQRSADDGGGAWSL
jgi:hypothetical protein